MKLIPMPKRIDIKEGFIEKKTVKYVGDTLDERLEKALLKLPLADDGYILNISVGDADCEEYTLEISEEKIDLKSAGIKGAFYGIQTLRQIFANDKIPFLYIEDKPDFANRGVYHDITRGKIPKIETLKEFIDQLVYYKINSFQLYIEHTFAFDAYADSIERTGCITADEIRELDDYCYENFIEFIPSMSTFGHLYELLNKPQYKHLCEVEDYEQKRIFWYERHLHHTIDPTKPESFELITGMIDQYMSLFRSNVFNICCDETFDLQKGRHKDCYTPELYTDFVKKLVNHVKSKGKTVMMWADILLQHPETIADMPDDVIYLNWFYDKNPDEEKIKILQDLNKKQLVCPGTSTWDGYIENVDREVPNIVNMIDYGYKYGAEGVLNTNWGDWGNPCSLELAMYGLLIGAEKSWNGTAVIDEDFNERVEYLLYKRSGAIKILTEISAAADSIKWLEFAQIYSNCLYDDKFELVFPSEDEMKKIQASLNGIVTKLSSEKWEMDEYREELILAALALEVMTELISRYMKYNVERNTDTGKFLEAYRNKWLQKNKESELREIEKAFNYLESNL